MATTTGTNKLSDLPVADAAMRELCRPFLSDSEGFRPEVVIVQPDDGVRPVLALIEQARHSLRIKQFTFSHPTLLDAVIEAHRRGVTVQVMLNPARSSGDRANDATFETLNVAVRGT